MPDLYIKKVTLPQDLVGVTPGKLDDSLLVKCDGGKLHHLAARAWNAMKAKAAAEGMELKPTSAGDLYRSYDAQKAAFLQRYVTTEIPGQSTRTFEGKKWWLKKGMAMLAVPGTSQHNLGIAVDVASASGARLEWMHKNCADFGFSWEVLPSEPWHIRYVEGDNIPEAVKAYEAANGVAPAAPAPTPKPTPAPTAAPAPAPVAASPAADVDAKRGKANSASNPVLKLGSKGQAVKTLQGLLSKMGFKTSVDGDFGPKTEAAVKEYQKTVGHAPDGVCGPKMWGRIYG